MADASQDALRPSCEELAGLVVELRAENAALRERIEELERKVNRNSGKGGLYLNQVGLSGVSGRKQALSGVLR